MSRFGLVRSFKAQPGQGDALAELLVRAADALDRNVDCELYVVSRSVDDVDELSRRHGRAEQDSPGDVLDTGRRLGERGDDEDVAGRDVGCRQVHPPIGG